MEWRRFFRWYVAALLLAGLLAAGVWGYFAGRDRISLPDFRPEFRNMRARASGAASRFRSALGRELPRLPQTIREKWASAVRFLRTSSQDSDASLKSSGYYDDP